MFNNKLTKDSVVEAVEKIIEAKKDDTTDVPWKSGIGVERKHTPRTDKQAMSAAHNAVGKGLKKAKSMSKEDFSFKDQLIENHKSKQFEIELIDEKEMSPAQSKKKEEIVLSMKDREKEFKAKYGKRWKEVMYATATKMAMKEETLDEKWDDDDEDDDVKRADAELKRMKAKPIHADKKTDPDKEIGKLAKKTPKEVDESVEQIDELNKDTLGSYVKKSSDAADKHLKLANSAAQRSKTKADTAQFLKHSEKFGKRTSGLKMAADRLNKEEVDLNESNYADMSHAAKELVLHADNDAHLHHSSHAPIMHNLSKKMKNGTYHPEKAKKLWAYHADRAAQSYAKHHGDGTPWHKMFSTSDRKAAASHWEDMHRHELNEAKGPETDNVPFVQNANPSSNPVTPLSRAKELAHSAMKRIKNEMLGKAGATSEEIDPNVKTTDMLRGRVKGGKKDDVGPGADGKSTKVKFTPGPK